MFPFPSLWNEKSDNFAILDPFVIERKVGKFFRNFCNFNLIKSKLMTHLNLSDCGLWVHNIKLECTAQTTSPWPRVKRNLNPRSAAAAASIFSPSWGQSWCSAAWQLCQCWSSNTVKITKCFEIFSQVNICWVISAKLEVSHNESNGSKWMVAGFWMVEARGLLSLLVLELVCGGWWQCTSITVSSSHIQT